MCSEPGKRFRLSDDDRRWLAVKAQALGREVLAEIASVATPAGFCAGTATSSQPSTMVVLCKKSIQRYAIFFFADH